MKRHSFAIAFALGALAVVWVAAAVAHSHLLVLCMCLVIGVVYVLGARELLHYRQATATLRQALDAIAEPLPQLDDWLAQLPADLHSAVRLRIEGERVALPGPALTPYLVGLLVMLGMLGTFLGMVVTLNGAVFALEGSTHLADIRAAFAEPIKGLGLAFGTSVAGVATSAMLGLMSSLVRRERAQASHILDTHMAGALRRFSLAHQRQETYAALQHQTQVLPQMMTQLQDTLRAMMAQMERTSLHINDRLLANQTDFHQTTQQAYAGLAQSVDSALRSSLTQSLQVASDGIRPVVQATMTQLSEQAYTVNERLQRSVESTLEAFSQTLAQRSESLVATLHSAYTAQQTAHSHTEQQRLVDWRAALQSQADALSAQWQRAGAQTLAQQQAICDTLTQTAHELTQLTQTQASHTLAEITRLLAGSEELVQARIAAEADWAASHSARAQALAELLRTELVALREAEDARGQAAVARLAELEASVTTHLATLGTALETPISRLIATASEAPKAAAEVIAQLRQEISASVARDNTVLEERSRIMATLNQLLQSIDHAATEQRSVIDALVSTSASTLQDTSQQFMAQVQGESDKLGQLAAQVSASAVDVASLSETFGFAVHNFAQTNAQLMQQLQRIETALDKSMTRSDEQLAYYVAQARELVELSIGAQHDVLSALQQKAGPAATAPGAA